MINNIKKTNVWKNNSNTITMKTKFNTMNMITKINTMIMEMIIIKTMEGITIKVKTTTWSCNPITNHIKSNMKYFPPMHSSLKYSNTSKLHTK